MSPDGLAIYFSRNNDLYVSHRASRAQPWAMPQQIVELATGIAAYDATIRPDELEIYFTRPAPTNCLYTSRRTATTQPWAADTMLTSFCLGSEVGGSYLTPDGLRLYYTHILSGNQEGEILMSTRTDVTQTFQPGVLVMVMATMQLGYPVLSTDEKTMYFEMLPAPLDLYMATRSDTTSAFGTPVVMDVSTAGVEDEDVSLTSDGLELFFDNDITGDGEIYTATRTCL